MSKVYWLHRIAHEWEISYTLLEKGYLCIGWRKFMDSDILRQISQRGWDGFNDFMEQKGESSRSRWNLWRFSQFKPGDIVVVPLFNKEFTIVEVEEPIFPVSKFCGQVFITQKGEKAEVHEDGIRKNTIAGDCYDVGFLVKVRPLRQEHIKRSFADARLVSRMKLRQANADITDLADSIEDALHAEGPVSLHEKLSDTVIANIQDVLQKYVTPDNLERVVKWYMEKKGASYVWIPPKNESEKKDGADADVIAEFEDLGLIFYIQVKNHVGVTDSWAINQIKAYANQKQDGGTGYTYIPWVITTAEFDTDTIQKGIEEGVRLIGGKEFIKMLIDCGIGAIDSATAE